MTTTPRSLKELFLGVLALPASERDGFLSHECGEDTPLRQQIEEMLAAHNAHHSLLDDDMIHVAGTAAATERLADDTMSAGTTIGPYKLLQQIGEGGMGAVFMAEQTAPIVRRVALKVIKPGMDSRQVIARFEAERQALAMMDHPNIAKVLDGGTIGGGPGGVNSGRPYFVMELVRGIPITKYCDEHQLMLEQRLQLFVQVCHAVQHAHQKGIIHRDLKPSNVLVAQYDDRPVPKVIDFGIAKASQKLTERTMFTEFGQVIGTLEYMSPEQARLNELDVDTRSDVYSLGVLLYELLTGCTPFDGKRLRSAAFDEVLRIIREEEPPKPSTRLNNSATLPAIAFCRNVEPARLGGILRGELDWIVMKALEKDRNRRYESTGGLARDIERYLRDEPVQACPPSTFYRIRKFARRYKGPVAAAAAVVLTLVCGIIGTTQGLVREHRAKIEGEKRLAQVAKATEILAWLFRDIDPTVTDREGVSPGEVSRRLIKAAQQLEGEAVGDPLVVARLQHVLGISLLELGEWNEATRLLVKASQTRERLLGADDLDTVDTLHYLAIVYRDLDDDRLVEAENMLKRVVAVRTAELGPKNPDTLNSQHFLAMVYFSKRDHKTAESILSEVLKLRTEELGADDPDTLTTKHRLATVYRSLEKYNDSERMQKEVLQARTDTLGADNLDTIATKGSLASLYLAQGKLELAEEYYNDVLAVRLTKLSADHPDTLSTRASLAAVYQQQKRFDEAETLMKEVLRGCTEKMKEDHRQTLAIKRDLARLHLWNKGQYKPAEKLFKELVATLTIKHGADSEKTLGAAYELAMLYAWQGNHPEAERRLRDVLAGYTRLLGANSPNALMTQHCLAECYQSQKRWKDAESEYRKVLAARTVRLSAGHADTIETRDKLAFVCWSLKDYKQAISLLEESFELRKAALKPDDPDLLARQVTLGELYCDDKQFDEGLARIEEVRGKGRQEPHPAWVRTVLLKAYVQAQKPAEAGELISERVRDARYYKPANSPELAGELIVIAKWAMDVEAFADAEPLLLEAYQGLRPREWQDPASGDLRVPEAITCLIELYDAWGKPDEAARWRKEADGGPGA